MCGGGFGPVSRGAICRMGTVPGRACTACSGVGSGKGVWGPAADAVAGEGRRRRADRVGGERRLHGLPAHQHAGGARRDGAGQKEPPGGVTTGPDGHGLDRSRGGFRPGSRRTGGPAPAAAATSRSPDPYPLLRRMGGRGCVRPALRRASTTRAGEGRTGRGADGLCDGRSERQDLDRRSRLRAAHRRGEEDRRQEAEHRHRHTRSPPRRGGHRGGRAGLRRRQLVEHAAALGTGMEITARETRKRPQDTRFRNEASDENDLSELDIRYSAERRKRREATASCRAEASSAGCCGRPPPSVSPSRWPSGSQLPTEGSWG